MQFKRRRCYSHLATLFYVLTLLGALLILVYQVQQQRSSSLAWFQSRMAKLNVSSQLLGMRLIVSPRTIAGTDANDVTSQYKEIVNNLVLNTSGDSSLPTGPFPYIIDEPDKCSDSGQLHFLVLLISTTARQVEERRAIRQTWANESVAPNLGVIRLFMLGTNSGELGLLQQKMVVAESKRYHDIIQQDFADTYNNLTLKTLMGLNWVAKHCPQASYVMKTDTDMFINTEYLIYKLLQPEVKPRTDYFTGVQMKDYSPIRDKHQKWYMSVEEYPAKRYPTFCSGTGYVLSGDLATKIYMASLGERILHLEDVFMGVCLAKLGLSPVPPPNVFLFNHYRVPYSSCKYSTLITSHGFRPNELLKYWHHLQSNKHNACVIPVKIKHSTHSRVHKVRKRQLGQ